MLKKIMTFFFFPFSLLLTMDKIGSYKLIKYLNRGAHGECHLYENTRDALRQKVVIKSVKMKCSQKQLGIFIFFNNNE